MGGSGSSLISLYRNTLGGHGPAAHTRIDSFPSRALLVSGRPQTISGYPQISVHSNCKRVPFKETQSKLMSSTGKQAVRYNRARPQVIAISRQFQFREGGSEKKRSLGNSLEGLAA
jgi:hypothetical protein